MGAILRCMVVGLTLMLSLSGCGLIPQHGYLDPARAAEGLRHLVEEAGNGDLLYLSISDNQVLGQFVINGQRAMVTTRESRPSQFEELDLAGRPIDIGQLDLAGYIELTRGYFPDCPIADLQVIIRQNGYDMHFVQGECGQESTPYFFLDGTHFMDINLNSADGLAAGIDRMRSGAPTQVFWLAFTQGETEAWLETVYADPQRGPVAFAFQGSGFSAANPRPDQQGMVFGFDDVKPQQIIACLDRLGEQQSGTGVWTLRIEPNSRGQLEYLWNLKGGWTSPKSYVTTDANCRPIG